MLQDASGLSITGQKDLIPKRPRRSRSEALSCQSLDTMRACVSQPDFYERLAIGGCRIIRAAMISRTPLRQSGEPKEVAAAYAWLASDEALFGTGAVLSVGGGIVVGT